MKTYRITTMVTQDVIAEDETKAASQAIDAVRIKIGDHKWQAPSGFLRSMWVTGIAQDSNGYMVYEMTPVKASTNE
jgi:hypothetical protein